jgi:6-phosphogluconolactonase (cycloisomerase 2 family)
MYVVGGSSSVLIYTYAIAPATGVLTSTGSPVTADPGSPEPTFGLTDPYGRFLYVCDQFDSVYTSTAAIYVYTINQTTGLLTAGTPVTANVDGCTSMLIDQSGSYLYAVNNFASNANGISAYSINQTTGALTALSPATYQTGSGPVFSTWDPTGTYLFAADSLDGTVTGYTLGTGGALTSMTTTTVTGATSLSSVAIPPSGSILYVLDAGPPSNVYAYSLSAGTVGSAVGTPQPAGQNPSYMSIDPTGAILAVNNVGDGTTAASAGISVFTIGSTGTLTAITPFVTTGAAPYFVTFYNVP